jgi:hypothetical protein
MLEVFWKKIFPSQSENDGATAIRYLLQGLQSPDREIRCEALKVLRLTIGSPVRRGAYAIPWSNLEQSLQQQLLHMGMTALYDEDESIRQEAARLLAKIQIRSSFLKNLRNDESVIDLFIPLLRDQNSLVRQEAACILRQIRNPRAIPALIPTLQDQHRAVRRAAATALKTLRWTPSHEQERMAYLFATEQWDQLAAIGSPVIELLAKFGNENHHGISETLSTICTSITTVVFGVLKEGSANPQTTWINPEVAAFTLPLNQLSSILLMSGTFDFYQAERFLTYAVNYIGQEHLQRRVDVHIYGTQEQRFSNLWNSLTNLCKNVIMHEEE